MSSFPLDVFPNIEPEEHLQCFGHRATNPGDAERRRTSGQSITSTCADRICLNGFRDGILLAWGGDLHHFHAERSDFVRLREEACMQCKRTSVIRFVKAMLFSLLLIIFAAGAHAQETVRIAVGVDPVFTPWWIAQEKGFYKKHGINAEITQFSGGPALADATMAGEADIGSSGTATWMPRIVRGSMVVLATMATSPDAFKMAARNDIKTLSDLRDKKVGSVGGSSTDYLWVRLAAKLNLPESAFDVIPMTPPELVPSLDRGDIQAYFVWEPWALRAVEVSGPSKVHILATSGDVGYLLNFVVVANKKFVDARPDAATRVLGALREAIEFQNRNPGEAAQIGADKNKLKVDMASYIIKLYQFSLGLSPDTEPAARTEEAWMRSKERLKGRPIDWGTTIDRRFLDRALATP
jgi:NitT/TauT family transport system substrate-binding protein